MSNAKEREIKLGVGIWEDHPVTLHLNMRKKYCGPVFSGKPCKHAIPTGETDHDDPIYVYPRVIEACNEGGCCSTGVCLDCVVEQAREKGVEVGPDLGQLDKLHLEDGDVLVIRGPNSQRIAMDFAKVRRSTNPTKVVVIALPDGDAIEKLDEAAMRKHGWVRLEESQ